MDARAFLGKRVIVDTELVLAYAELTKQDPMDAARKFGARLTKDNGTCKMTYKTRTLGWQCSACGRITRGYEDARMNFCPNCGAQNMT